MNETPSVPMPVSVEAWPANEISSYTHLKSGNWGFLECYTDGSFKFVENVEPSQEAIIKRWGKAILENAELGTMTNRHYRIETPVRILFNGRFFIGCQLSATEAVVESVESWETKRAAEMAIFENTWTRIGELQTTSLSNATE